MDTRSLTRAALMAALVGAVTLVVRIPSPGTGGYINLGDTLVVTAALLFGARTGALAGGIGSALADLLGGYFVWAPLTLIIKGCEGFLVGFLFRFRSPRDEALQQRSSTGRIPTLMAVVAALTGGLCMVSGYLVAEWLLYGWGAAASELPGNLLQGLAAVLIGVPLALTLIRKRYLR